MATNIKIRRDYLFGEKLWRIVLHKILGQWKNFSKIRRLRDQIKVFL